MNLRPRLRSACALGLFSLALGAACGGSTRSLRRHPEPQRVTVERARAASESQQWSLAASSWYELYLRRSEDAPLACVEAARALAKLDDIASARNLLDQGFQRYPERLELLEAQAEILEEAGFARAAEPYLERVLERDPDRLPTLLSLARVRVELSLEDKALPLLERRVALGGADALTWRLIARAQHKAARVREALDAYAKAFAFGENDPDRLVYAAGLYVESKDDQRGDFDPALVRSWLRRALELDPQLGVGHEYLGRLLEAAGESLEATASYERALELAPERHELALRLGRVYRGLGNKERAAALAGHALISEKDLERRAEFESWLLPPAPRGDGK